MSSIQFKCPLFESVFFLMVLFVLIIVLLIIDIDYKVYLATMFLINFCESLLFVINQLVRISYVKI